MGDMTFLFTEICHDSGKLVAMHLPFSQFIVANLYPPHACWCWPPVNESTNIGCNQWLSLTKIALKVPPLVGIIHWWPTLAGVGRVLV